MPGFDSKDYALTHGKALPPTGRTPQLMEDRKRIRWINLRVREGLEHTYMWLHLDSYLKRIRELYHRCKPCSHKKIDVHYRERLTTIKYQYRDHLTPFHLISQWTFTPCWGFRLHTPGPMEINTCWYFFPERGWRQGLANRSKRF